MNQSKIAESVHKLFNTNTNNYDQTIGVMTTDTQVPFEISKQIGDNTNP